MNADRRSKVIDGYRWFFTDWRNLVLVVVLFGVTFGIRIAGHGTLGDAALDSGVYVVVWVLLYPPLFWTFRRRR